MATVFLGTYAVFEVNGVIVPLNDPQIRALNAYLTAPEPIVNGKVAAIKAVREWHRLTLKEAKELVEVLVEREITS